MAYKVVEARRSGKAVVSHGVAEQIARSRAEEVDRKVDALEKDLKRAEQSLEQAESHVSAMKVRYGRRSGNKNLQQALSLLKISQRKVAEATRQVATAKLAYGHIEADRQQLAVAIERYLDGEDVSGPCGDCDLNVEASGVLSVYFRHDGKKLVRKQGHGHIVIRPDGTVKYNRLHGESHGMHNAVA